MKITRTASVAVLLVLGATITACSKKGPECEQFVATLNPNVEKLNKAMAMPDDKPEEALAEAKEVQKVTEEGSAAFAKLTLTVPELVKLAGDYNGLLKEVTTSAKSTQETVKAYQDIAKKLEVLPAQMKSAMEKLTKSCGEDHDPQDADECKAIAEMLMHLPKDPTNATEVAKFTGDLSKLEMHKNDMKAVVTEVNATLNGFVKVGADAKAAAAKAKAATEQQEAAIKKQNQTVEALNKFCAG